MSNHFKDQKTNALVLDIADRNKVTAHTFRDILLGITRTVDGFEESDRPVLAALQVADANDREAQVRRLIRADAQPKYFAALDELIDELGATLVKNELNCGDVQDATVATLYSDGSVSVRNVDLDPWLAWSDIDSALADNDFKHEEERECIKLLEMPEPTEQRKTPKLPDHVNDPETLLDKPTLRDRFAIAAMQGMVTGKDPNSISANVSAIAYRIADEMMKRRDENENE